MNEDVFPIKYGFPASYVSLSQDKELHPFFGLKYLDLFGWVIFFRDSDSTTGKSRC